MYRRDDLDKNSPTLAPCGEIFLISPTKVQKILKALPQSAQVTDTGGAEAQRGSCVPPVWNRQCLMNPAGPVNGIPGLFFPLLLLPGSCGSHDTGPGRGLKRGAEGRGQEVVKVA